MHKAIVAAALLLTTSTIALAQQDRATDITAAQVQQVLKAPSKIVDHTLKVVDLGNYALSVAVIKRGPTRAPGTGRLGKESACSEFGSSLRQSTTRREGATPVANWYSATPDTASWWTLAPGIPRTTNGNGEKGLRAWCREPPRAR